MARLCLCEGEFVFERFILYTYIYDYKMVVCRMSYYCLGL